MRQKGYEYTGSQCETKFKNLKQNYTKTVDHSNVSGNDKKTCPYFEELSEIFGMTPCVKPIAVCSNRAASPTSGFQADACSSSSSGGSLASAMQELSSDNERVPPKEKKPVSIKHGLRTADHELRTGYKTRTRYKMRTAD